MKSTFFAVLFSIGAFFVSSASQANPEALKKGWEAFNQNKRTEAKAFFTSAAQSPDTKAEASLALAFVYWSENNGDKAFENFQTFFSNTTDPYPYVYALWSTPIILEGFNGKRKPAKLAFIEQILKDPRANGTLRAMVYAAIGDHYQNIGKFKEANEAFAGIGSIGNWQVLGTFDNISANGFNKSFGALEHPEASATFTHQYGAPVKWFNVPAERSDRWFDLTYYFDASNAIMYAQTWVQSPQEVNAIMRSGCSGSLKIWVNDQLITSVAEERNCDLDIYAQPVHLQKGYNRVLVQIGESEAGRANFLIRFTDANGNPIQGLSSTPTPQPYTKVQGTMPAIQPFFAEAFFEQKIKQEPTNLLNYLVLAEAYLRNDKKYEARKTLQKARDLAPQSTFVSMRLIEAYNRDGNETEAGKEQEHIRTSDPTSVIALQQNIAEAQKKEEFDQVERHLSQYKQLYGTNEFTDMVEIGLYAKRNQINELLKFSEEFYHRYPDNEEAVTFQYVILTEVQHDQKKADELLKKAIQERYNDKFIKELASNYLKQGDKKEAQKLYLQRIENFPYAVGFYTQLADLYSQDKDYENAQKYMQKALEFAPYIGGLWQRLATVYEYQNQTEKAKDAYRKSIQYMPTLFESHKALRRLENKKDLFGQFAATNADDLFKNAPKAEAFPNDNSIILLNEMQRIVYPEGATEERNELVVKILTQAGIETWKEYTIPFNSNTQRLIIDKTETLKADGNKVPAETQDNYLVFTNLQAGDAIHISYRLENLANGKLLGYFADEFLMNYGLPSTLSRYSLLMPSAAPIKYEVKNATITPQISTVDDYKKYVWELRDNPGITGENFMPVMSDAGINLKISNMPDWNFIGKWYADLATTKARSDFEVKETVASLFKNAPKLTDLQKAKRIYDYILNTINYSSVAFRQSGLVPQRASRTLSTKLGDCKDLSTLFVAMCKEVGLKANLVLIDTRDNGDHHLSLPSIDFNHCIARFQTEGKTYFVELTNPYLSFGTLGTSLLHTNALLIPAEGESQPTSLMQLNTPDRPANTIVRSSVIKVDGKDLVITTKNTRTGDWAADLRANNASKGRESQEKTLQQSIASDYSNQVKLLDFGYDNLETRTDTARSWYSYRVSKEIGEVAGISIMKLPWQEGLKSLDFVSEEKRLYPFLMWSAMPAELFKETISIELPTGKKLIEVPASVKASCPAAEYSLTFKVENGKLIAVREFRQKQDLVAPADYAQLKDFFNKVVEADTKQIAFK
ncbi:MAG: DUF3857 domain-containing protein [Spirosomataceae bacterium]